MHARSALICDKPCNKCTCTLYRCTRGTSYIVLVAELCALRTFEGVDFSLIFICAQSVPEFLWDRLRASIQFPLMPKRAQYARFSGEATTAVRSWPGDRGIRAAGLRRYEATTQSGGPKPQPAPAGGGREFSMSYLYSGPLYSWISQMACI